MFFNEYVLHDEIEPVRLFRYTEPKEARKVQSGSIIEMSLEGSWIKAAFAAIHERGLIHGTK